MSLEVSIILILFISYLFSLIAQRLHLSRVIGLIFAGLILTMPPFKGWLVVGNEMVFERLANLGLLTLMFLAGFEVSWNMLKKERRDAIIITLFTVITSLVLGVSVCLMLGFSWGAALIMGVCFGITAEGTKARVLLQLKKIKTRIGALLMGTGIINDIIGVILLLIITYVFTRGFNLAEAELLGGVLLAFGVGVYVHYKFDRFSKEIRLLEKILLIVAVPFFFVNLGIHFDILSLSLDPRILIIIIITATAGQILGVMLTRPLTHLEYKQLFLIGWGMNSKGAVELAIAFIALSVGLLPAVLYSSLVVASLVSTIIFQIIIFRMIKRYPKIMK